MTQQDGMQLRGGGQFTARPHLLTLDGQTVLVCHGNFVRAHSAVTGEPLYRLTGHTAEVTAVLADPDNAKRVYTSSLDGTLRHWDLRSGLALRTWRVPEPVESFALGPPGHAWLSCPVNDASGRLFRYDLTTGTPGPLRRKIASGSPLSMGSRGGLVATFERHTVLVWGPKHGPRGALSLFHTKPFTCVALSPDDDTLAAGDRSGRILVWRGIRAAAESAAEAVAATGAVTDAGRAPPPPTGAVEEAVEPVPAPAPPRRAAPPPPAPEPATVHWHAQAVGALAFSADGTYLFSGGREAVLVVWDFASARRTYLPRLGGALVGICACPADAARLALRQADNTLRVVNVATMKVEASVMGLRPVPAGKRARAPALLQPGTGHLVVAGSHSQVQFYDLVRDAHVDRLQLSPHNLGGAEAGTGPEPPPPRVTHLAFSADGSTLASVEARPDAAPGSAPRLVPTLKFWGRAAARGAGAGYVLGTRADDPHRGDVSALAFHPARDAAASASLGAAEFKLWVRDGSAPRSAGPEASRAAAAAVAGPWRCAAVGSYASQPISALAYSPDGSLLVAAAGATLTLWHAGQARLLGLVPPPLPRQVNARPPPARQVAVLSHAALAVSALDGGLAVSCLLSRRVLWAAGLPVLGLAADPGSSHWAAVLGEPAAAARGGGGGAAGTAAQELTVLLFRGAERLPAAAWQLRRLVATGAAPAAPQILFVPPGCELAGAASGATHPGSSPLVLLGPDRHYSLLRRAGAGAGVAVAATMTGPVAAADVDGDPVQSPAQGLSAMFAPEAAGQAGDKSLAQGTPLGSAAPWATLLDAPSHVLPSLDALCPAFLKLLLPEGEVV
ncbi:hypothetical protein ACKKBG_A23240 [Auxenochlorella protothecoides x Auxenochlorella symbiontica]